MNKSYFALLGLGVLVVVTLSIFSYSEFRRLLNSSDISDELFAERQELYQLVSALKDAETGQRGYLITGKEDYLEPYNDALKAIPTYLDHIHKYQHYDEESFQSLNNLIQLKMNELEDRIQIRRRLGFNMAQKAVKTDEGKQYMDEIRSNITQHQNQIRKALEQNQSYVRRMANFAKWLLILGGLISPMLISLFLYLLYQDMKAKKEISDALQTSHNVQKAILESAKQLIVTTDANGLIKSFNKGAENLLGYKAEETINKLPVLDLYDKNMINHLVQGLPWRKRSPIRSNFEMLVSPSRYSSLSDADWLLKSKEGRLIPCLQSISTLCDYKNQVIGFLFIATDMTERKIWEENLQKTLEAADSANLAKSKFLANISHDLRTPLNSIIGFSNILLKNKMGHLQEQEITFITRIIENGKFLLNLINEVLDLSKIEVGFLEIKKIPVSLSTLIQDVLNQLEGKVVDRNLKLIADVPDHVNPLETDPEKLKTVLINLVGNGIKYTNEGEVKVKVKVDSESHQAIEIQVTDTGIGIEQKNLKRVFDTFFQVDSGLSRRYEGSGLGLSIARSICQKLGYQLEVKSEIGKGSTFTIMLNPDQAFLPFLEEKLIKEERSPSKSYDDTLMPQNFYNQTVLIIDNDTDFLTFLRKQFKDLGCKVLLATTGEQGLAIAKSNHVDLITMGMIMTPMNGYDIASRLQKDEELRKIPFAFITVVAAEIQGKIPGALGCLTKDVSHNDLINLLKKASIYHG